MTGRPVSPGGYGRFLIDVFEDWVRHDVGAVYVQMFDVALANWYGAPRGCASIPETCGLALALEHTGDLYSCDHFVEPACKLGNIRDKTMIDLITAPRQTKFGLAKRETLPGFCRRCDVRFACHGGCPKDRFTFTPDGEPGLHYLCPSYKAFFDHIRPAMEAMCGLLRARQASSQITDRYAKADAKRGRNESCPCGSDRKWKKCHGAPCSQAATALPDPIDHHPSLQVAPYQLAWSSPDGRLPRSSNRGDAGRGQQRYGHLAGARGCQSGCPRFSAYRG